MMCRYARDCSECSRAVCPLDDDDAMSEETRFVSARDDWWDER